MSFKVLFVLVLYDCSNFSKEGKVGRGGNGELSFLEGRFILAMNVDDCGHETQLRADSYTVYFLFFNRFITLVKVTLRRKSCCKGDCLRLLSSIGRLKALEGCEGKKLTPLVRNVEERKHTEFQADHVS